MRVDPAGRHVHLAFGAFSDFPETGKEGALGFVFQSGRAWQGEAALISRNGHFPQEGADCGGAQNKVLEFHIRVRAGIDAVHKSRLRRGVDLIEQGERRLIFEG